jgi:hypothetical protein
MQKTGFLLIIQAYLPKSFVASRNRLCLTRCHLRWFFETIRGGAENVLKLNDVRLQHPAILSKNPCQSSLSSVVKNSSSNLRVLPFLAVKKIHPHEASRPHSRWRLDLTQISSRFIQRKETTRNCRPKSPAFPALRGLMPVSSARTGSGTRCTMHSHQARA